MELTQITETLYALPVPIDANDFEAIEYIDETETEIVFSDKNNYCINDIIPCFNGIYKIIGTVTQEEIDFGSVTIENLSKSIEYMVHSGITAFDEMKYYDYCITDFGLDSAEESFRSLLSSKGINPTPETKLLIIEKV